MPAEKPDTNPLPKSQPKQASGGRGKPGRKSPLKPPKKTGAIDLDIDEEALGRKVYPGSPGSRDEVPSLEPVSSPEGSAPLGSPAILRRQDVRQAFGGDIQALNEAIFQQTDNGAIDPVELNKDVDLLIQNLSDRLSDDASRSIAGGPCHGRRAISGRTMRTKPKLK